MNRKELLAELEKRGVTLWVENDKLSIEAPKGVLTPELRDSLREHKQEIIRLLQITETNTTSVATIKPDPQNRYEPFPLTDIQQAYWVGRSGIFELGNVAINGYIEFESSNLDLLRLSAAWQKLIERHDMLRAIILPTGEQQILQNVPPYEISILDLRGLEPKEIDARLQGIRQTLSHQVLPSDQWPLFNIQATYLDNERFRLHIGIDLLMMDAASIRILFYEWNQLYQNPEIVLTPLELSFRDYVLHKKALSDPQLVTRSQDYWFSRLDTLPPAPELPLACFPSQLKEYRFKRLRAGLKPNIWQQLKQRGRNASLTPSTILLAAFAEILTLWSKNPRFTINLTVFERLPLHSQVNQIIGDFTNTNLLAVDNSTQDTFTVRALRLQQQLSQDLDHVDISGVEVVREFVRRRKTGLTAVMPIVFTSILGLNSSTQGDLDFNFLGEEVYSISQTPQVWLDHQVIEQNGALVFNWDVVEELFPQNLLDEMFTAYCHFLEKLAQEDELWDSVRRELLPQAQLKQLVAVNATTKPIPEAALLHTLFFEQARLLPHQMAIVSTNYSLTYHELATCATQLGYQLRQISRPNRLIAIVMEKGWEQIVAALGILVAGAAYVPIDPQLPTERRRYLLEQAEVDLVLTQTKLDNTLDWSEDIQRLCIDDSDLKQLPNSLLNQPLEVVQKPEDLAYVIYTSGSTGTPKGVMITHQGAVNTILDVNQRFNVNPNDRVLALSSLSFDLSVYDIFGTLAAGGTIVIPEAGSTKDPAVWAELMIKHQVSVWNSVPALMKMLVEYASDHREIQFNTLRLVLLSGDWIPLSLPNQIKTLCSQVKVISLGGATEASIWSIFYPIEEVNSGWKSIPYGRPMANQRFYVLNELMEPTPTWVSGQLYIGGMGLAKGYWRDEDKTKASFIIHPFTQERLYKTGDLGRYLPDGNIEFIGRVDNQIKLRGFRIELGEIEAILSTHPLVQQAVVIAKEDIPENKQLVAYLVSADQSLTTHQLREFLKLQLPEYMVPSAFVTLDTLPLTPNGKIDRKVLPTPDGVSREDEYIAPRTPTEEIIASTFASVLGVENVGIHDDFFNLGGHSLLATQLISRLRVAFTIEIPLRAVFESPTVTQLDQTITQLRSVNSGLVVPPIQRMEVDKEVLSLSWAQERLWFLNQLEGSSATYNMPVAVGITGNLDVNALQRALSEIVCRHSILRTSIQTVNGTPRQMIHPEATMNINVVDLQQLPTTERETIQKQLTLEQAITPFNLEIAPLIRCSLLQLSGLEYVLLLTMHHIVSDGWSMGVFIQELSTLYQAYCAGALSPLPELPIQYADFAVWQRQWLRGEVLETQLNYWLSELRGVPTLLQLPTDRPRPVVQTYQGKTQNFTLDGDLTQKLQSLSSESGTTLFMNLVAAFATLLHRYTGQSDILVGTPIANRNRSEIESLIGFFVNTLVLKTNFAANPSFQSLLSQVRQTTLQAYQHQDVPFEQVVEALQPQRSLAYSPVFQVMFVWQNAPLDQVELPGITLSPLASQSTVAKFDLTLSISETEQGLVGQWEYNTDLFDGSTIERMASHFQNLLCAIVENPLATVSELPLLSEAECHQLLMAWNDTKTEYPQDKCIHQLFEEQVEKTPHNVALVFDNQQLTYLELNTRANQLANYLQTLGVGAEVLVGICVERSIEMVVGLLGILKAGGAYVPFDPDYPTERLRFMIEDAQVKVLLTQQHLVDKLPQYPANKVFLDTNNSAISWLDKGNLTSTTKASNLAYVIYTSGSTGQPKGVLVAHQALLNLVKWHQSTFQITSSDKTAQVASIAFDAAVWELLPYLTTGASIYLLEREILTSPVDLQDWLISKNITISFLPTPVAEQLLSLEWNKNTALRTLLTGGDKLHQYPSRLLPFQVVNNYGPTENTVVTTSGIVVADGSHNNISPPIGRPIANTQVYILDEYLQPVPIGVAGELHIGGASLARGYLNRVELTQQKFISNPFSTHPGSRLYKTGDLARYLPDGNIEYLGRIDNQIKIRGFRIELGEIEAVLSTHPLVQQAVVIAKEDIPGNQRIIAYLVPANQSLSTHQLREFLKLQLPEYMVPSAFVTLETLPLTLNGKIDIKALPIADTREQKYVAPRTPSEQIIADSFTVVLGVENVGIYDNFFDLGGHSLIATQLIARLREAFTAEIPIRAVFESPTIAQLDQTISQMRADESRFILPPIQPIQGEIEQIPLSFAQERLWFLSQLEGATATYNIPAAVRISGELDLKALQQALIEIVSRHSILRTSFRTVNGKPIQVIEPEATIKINVVDLQQDSATQREAQVLQEAQTQATTPFNLEIAPLIRCNVLVLSAQEYVLLLTMHHIVSDGWSIGVLVSEISALYQASCTGSASPLPELSIQYADFAVWQRQWLSGQVLEKQLNYWQAQLQGIPELLQLPTDRPRPVVQTYHGRTHGWKINADLSKKLQNLSRESGTTLFMTLLAGFASLLYRYTSQLDIVIGSPIANRKYSEIESLIGFFVNTLVLRTQFEDNPTFESVLSQVRETTLQSYEHQDIPFEQVVEALQPQRSLSYSPLFQVMFVLQNTPIGKVELPGVTLAELAYEKTVANFDLTLSMREIEDGLEGVWEYNTDLFDGSTIERMVGHFHNLLATIVENPQVLVGEIPLLSEAERHQLLVEWNETKCKYPIDKCIHELFEEQVEKTPDNVAVVFENQQLTYQQLNQRANQLAHHLQSLGVEPEVLVGICVERSLEMVVGLLGILKAGGAYVPLDPNYPAERLSYMLTDSGVKVLLTQNKWVSHLSEHQAQVICLDLDLCKTTLYSQQNPTGNNTYENLAYIIYTSGSTGKSKGVMITHRALSSFTKTALSEYAITASDRVLQFASINFDAAVEEIYPCLCTGATLVLRTNEMLADLQTFLRICCDLRLTVVDLPTAYWHQLVADLAFSNAIIPESLRLVIIGGEKVLPQPVRYWQEYVAKSGKRERLQLINTYGPTETTVSATLYRIPSSTCLTEEIPIGRPLAHIQTYILDPHLQPVPVGVTGELYIGGDGLARGYLNHPELTTEKFIPNPFSNTKSERLYKTGDLARYLADGNIEFIGRIDNQIKIRGFRIELGEIEAVLSTHPLVQQAVVIAKEDIPGNQRLVAYIVPANQSLSTHQLREFLKLQLPEYMVPSAFVTLHTLPLTPNNKIDRLALKASDIAPLTLDTTFIPPRNFKEQQLVQIWSEVLDVYPVGIQDNFFDLGGHSLLAVHLMAKIQNQFGKNIPLASLFQSPTIEQLASFLEDHSDDEGWSTLVPIQPTGNRIPLFCIHPIGGNVLCYANLARYLGVEQPFYGLQSPGLNGKGELLSTVEDMAAYYIKAVQTIQPQGPYQLAGWSLGGVIAFEIAQQLQHQGHEVALLALIDSYASITVEMSDEVAQKMLVPYLLKDLSGLFGRDLALSVDELQSLTEEEILNSILEQAKSINIFPSEFGLEQMRQMLQVFQTNYQAAYRYLPKPYSGRISLFCSTEKLVEGIQDSSHSWSQLAAGGLEIYQIPGNHYTIIQEPYVQVLAEQIQAKLN